MFPSLMNSEYLYYDLATTFTPTIGTASNNRIGNTVMVNSIIVTLYITSVPNALGANN